MGRCAALEVLIGSSALVSIIRDGNITQVDSLIQTGKKEGMQTMDQHLQALSHPENNLTSAVVWTLCRCFH